MIHCLITRKVQRGKEADFEAAIRSFFSESIADANTTGAQLVTPLEDEKSNHYGILRSFPDEESRDAFYQSDSFRNWESHVEGFVEGPAEHRELHGLEAFFREGGTSPPPPVWKMALVTWIGVNLVTTPLLMILMPILVGTYGLRFPFDNFAFNIFVVAALSWIVMPLIVKLSGKWLSKPPKPIISSLDPSTPKQPTLWQKTLRLLLSPQVGESLKDRSIALFALFLGVTTSIIHGWPKIIGAINYFTTGEPWRDIDLVVALGLPFPALMATVAGLVQFICSLAVATGLLTRLNALLVASTLVVALYWNASQGASNEVALLYFVGFVFLALTSSGRPSLDLILERRVKQ
ncbi:MAG: DoxX family membrane protein [Verrucomicrobiota bacterium]